MNDENDQDELEQHKKNGNLLSGWGAQKLIRYGFPELQPSIHTITPGNMKSSGEQTYPS